MKKFEEIKEDKRFQSNHHGDDGGDGWVTLKGKVFSVRYSTGGGWDHVSVSLKDRCPSWGEMCCIKSIFFNENECCVEYHPAKKDYVNIHPFCLHIWKPQGFEMPKPNKYMV